MEVLKLGPGLWKSMVLMVGIVIISVLPEKNVPQIPVWNADKLIHSAVYFVLTVVLVKDFLNCGPFAGRLSAALGLAIAIAVLFGGLLEGVQAILPINRTASWLDFLANCLGIAAAAGLFFWDRRVAGRFSRQ